MTKTDSILLSLSLLSSLPTFLISLLFSPRRSSFVSSSRRKQKRRKECRKSVVLRDTKFRSDPFRSMEDSAQGLFENEKEREREKGREGSIQRRLVNFQERESWLGGGVWPKESECRGIRIKDLPWRERWATRSNRRPTSLPAHIHYPIGSSPHALAACNENLCPNK